MLKDRQSNSDTSYPTNKMLTAMLSILVFLSIILLTLSFSPYDSVSSYTEADTLPISVKTQVYHEFSNDNSHSNPVIAVENTYYDSDWDLKNITYALKEFNEDFSGFSVIPHNDSGNSFNYTNYYGFSPLRSPPAV